MGALSRKKPVSKLFKSPSATCDVNDEVTMNDVGLKLLTSGGAHKPTYYDFGNGEKIDLKDLKQGPLADGIHCFSLEALVLGLQPVKIRLELDLSSLRHLRVAPASLRERTLLLELGGVGLLGCRRRAQLL